MAITIADLVAQYRAALVNAATVAINDATVAVILGNPGPNQPDDIVSIGVPSGVLDPATLTAGGRNREMTLTCTVTFSIYRAGGTATEAVVTTQAFALFSAIERRVRVDDITLGGVVRTCLCTSWGDASDTAVQVLSKGRLLEFPAVFEARARLTNL